MEGVSSPNFYEPEPEPMSKSISSPPPKESEESTAEIASPETVAKASTVVIEDPETHKQLKITPTKPPKHYTTTNNLMAKAAANISTTAARSFLSQAPLLATSVGQTVLSGSMAAVVGAVDVARSNNKKRSIARVLPTIGLSLIPGIGLPLAIGLGIATSYTADKIYVNAAISERYLELEQFWSHKFDFQMIKESFLQVWVTTYTEIAEDYCHCTPKYHKKAEEVIELILWLIEALVKLRKEFLIDWHWKSMSIADFDKNIKEIAKGIKMSEIEIDEICKVIREGSEKFIKKVNPCSKKGLEKNESFTKRVEALRGFTQFLEPVRLEIKEGIKDAMKYLKDEEKRLH